MYIAMNRFRIAEGHEEEFEEIWNRRISQLDDVDGFQEFHLLKGARGEGETLYASHSTWQSEAAFNAWTRSENFRTAHAGAGTSKGTYIDHPQFEGFEVIL